MRQILKLIILGVLMICTLSGFAQTLEKDFIFYWQNNNDNMWISIDSTCKKFTPSVEEIRFSKDLSINYIDSLERIREPKIKKQYGKILKFDHKDYYRQYVGFIDKKGNRIIFINACCSVSGQDKNLNKNWIFVLDGGSCYFQIKIDLKTKKCFDFSVNGDA